MSRNPAEGTGEGGELASEYTPDATDFFCGRGYTEVHKEVAWLGIYLDLAVALNTLVDFLLLMGTNTLAGFPTHWRRCLGGAVLGGIYAGVCLLPPVRFLGSMGWRIVFLGLMASVAFGWNRGSGKRIGIFLLLSMALGGIAVSLHRIRLPGLILSSLGLWLLCRICFGSGVGEQSYVDVTIRYGDAKVDVLALRDTGNTLRDPVTGEPVLVLSADAACTLTGLTRQQLASPLETLAEGKIPGLRLIPYRAVGQGNGMLLALAFEDVTIGKKRGKALVAFDPGGLGSQTMYQALTGGVF